MDTSGLIESNNMVLVDGTTNNCCITLPSYTYTNPYNLQSAQYGEFDVHLDRTGILRVFHGGKMVAQLKPEAKKFK